MKRYLFFLILFALPLSAEMLIRTKVAMGTFASISLMEQDKKYFLPAFDIIKDVELSLSSYNQNSPIFRLNKNKKVKLDTLSYEALSLSKNYHKRTNGYFNIAIGSVTKDLYKFGEDESLPTQEALQNSETSLVSLVFDKENAKIAENIKIDLGGMGKGFGVDKTMEFLSSRGVKKAIVALSGDIRCLESCSIEIQNPFKKQALARFETQKQEMGISTSGNYNRYVKDKRNNHLINPKTKQSQKSFASITLISKLPNSDLDAYATAASVMPQEQAYSFLDSLELAYVVVEVDKSVVVSKNIELFVKSLFFYDRDKE